MKMFQTGFLETKVKVEISFLSSCLLTCGVLDVFFWSKLSSHTVSCASLRLRTGKGGLKPLFEEEDEQESCSGKSVMENLGRRQYAASRSWEQ